MRRALVFSLALGLGGCSSCGSEPSSAAEAGIAAAEPPVPPPASMLGEIVITTPNATWSRLQKGMGGAVGILPFTFGGLLCTLAGVDPSLGPEIDGASPAYAVLGGEPSDPAFVVAAKLGDPRHARAVMIDGENARYSAKDAEGITELVPKGMASSVAIGIAPGGYFLVARTSDDLRKLGPYAYRTLPKKAPTSHAIEMEVPRAALSGKIKERAEQSWTAFKNDKAAQDDKMRKDHGGRAPDFADPQAILSAIDAVVQHKMSLVSDLDKAVVDLDVGDDDDDVTATFVPAKAGPASQYAKSMAVGDASPLLTVDAEAPLAVMFRDDQTTRLSDAADWDRAVASALGKRVADADNAKLKGLLEDWAKGRGDWMTLQVTWSSSPGLLLRTPAKSSEAATRAVRSALELAKSPGFREPLETHVKMKDIAFSTVDVAPLGKVQVATLVRDEPKSAITAASRDAGAGAGDAGASPAKRLAVAWIASGDMVRVALSDDAPALLAATPGKTLRDVPLAQTALAKAEGSSFVLVAQPERLDARHASQAQPVVFAWGRKDDAVVLRASLKHSTLREVLRKQLGM